MLVEKSEIILEALKASDICLHFSKTLPIQTESKYLYFNLVSQIPIWAWTWNVQRFLEPKKKMSFSYTMKAYIDIDYR